MPIDESWAEEMDALVKCLGERPDAIEGAGVLLSHLGHFYENAHEFAHECHPDDVQGTSLTLILEWMRAAAHTLEPLGAWRHHR